MPYLKLGKVIIVGCVLGLQVLLFTAISEAKPFIKEIRYNISKRVSIDLDRFNKSVGNILFKKGTYPIYIQREAINNNSLGEALELESKCIITLNARKEETFDTLIHEIGHCFGLGHVSIPGEVMSPREDVLNKNAYTRFRKDLLNAYNKER